MYLSQSISDGLKILGLDKETIKKVAREKSLEEIFLSTLFMNYLIVLIAFAVSMMNNGIIIGNKELNENVFFGILMVYPFLFNLVIYATYGFFGLIAELINKNKQVKPLISVGFHTAIVYSILIYIIGLITTFNPSYGLFLFGVFMMYFLLVMFIAISQVYSYSTQQTLIVLFLPILFIFAAITILLLFVEPSTLISWMFN